MDTSRMLATFTVFIRSSSSACKIAASSYNTHPSISIYKISVCSTHPGMGAARTSRVSCAVIRWPDAAR